MVSFGHFVYPTRILSLAVGVTPNRTITEAEFADRPFILYTELNINLTTYSYIVEPTRQ
jgi:hypothetical protein